jgi:hypothetical protein
LKGAFLNREKIYLNGGNFKKQQDVAMHSLVLQNAKIRKTASETQDGENVIATKFYLFTIH